MYKNLTQFMALDSPRTRRNLAFVIIITKWEVTQLGLVTAHNMSYLCTIPMHRGHWSQSVIGVTHRLMVHWESFDPILKLVIFQEGPDLLPKNAQILTRWNDSLHTFIIFFYQTWNGKKYIRKSAFFCHLQMGKNWSTIGTVN